MRKIIAPSKTPSGVNNRVRCLNAAFEIFLHKVEEGTASAEHVQRLFSKHEHRLAFDRRVLKATSISDVVSLILNELGNYHPTPEFLSSLRIVAARYAFVLAINKREEIASAVTAANRLETMALREFRD